MEDNTNSSGISGVGRPSWLILLIVFCLVAAPKVAFLVRSANSWELQTHNDEHRHLKYAENIWNHGVSGHDEGIPDDREPVLYPLYLAPFVGLIDFRPVPALWGQVAIWSAAGVLAFLIAGSLYGRVVAWATVGLFATYFPGMTYPSYFFTEAQALLLMMLSVYCVIRWEQAGSEPAGNRWAFTTGIMCALHALTRVIAFPLVLPAVAYIAWRKWRGGQAWVRPALLVGLGFLICYAPWVIRNQVVLGRPTVLLSKGDRAFSFGHRSAVFLAQGMSLEEARIKAKDLSIPTPTGVSNRLLAMGQRFQIMMGCNMRLGIPFPFAGRHFGNSRWSNWANYLWNACMFLGLFVACGIALVRRDEVLGFLILFPFGLVVLYSIVHAIPRYQALPYLLWCLPSAYGWVFLLGCATVRTNGWSPLKWQAGKA